MFFFSINLKLTKIFQRNSEPKKALTLDESDSKNSNNNNNKLLNSLAVVSKVLHLNDKFNQFFALKL